MNICNRIREERERLGFDQEGFAALGSASRHSQIDWEKGKSFPNAKVLAAFAQAGADVQYILTGVRSSTVAQETATHTALNGREAALLDNSMSISKDSFISLSAARLRDERKRLGLNQSDFGALGGVQKDAQLKYEAGKRNPDSAYLVAIAQAGADVQYILTGVRSSAIAQETATHTALNKREAALLDNYRHIADEGDRSAVERTALMAARASHGEQESGAKRKAV